MIIRKAIIVSLLFVTTRICFAHNFGEHQDIGNKVMSLFFSTNRVMEDAIFRKYSPFSFDTLNDTYIFTDLSINKFSIGYGTINALSGDHSENPLILEQQLLTQNSNLLKTIALHNQYINLGYSGAPDNELTKIDIDYAKLALKNMGHFYEYGNGFCEHLKDFNIQFVDDIINPSLIKESFKKLNGTNAINMYVTLHATAIYLAEIAGMKAKTNDPSANKYLYYAFLYNGFADHFLEDSFSSGHLLVNRTIFGSVINNKALHDFYSENGTEVINLRGEYWTAYGDKFYNQYHDNFTSQDSLKNISYPHLTEETKRIIEAVHISVTEVYNAFTSGFKSESNFVHISKRVPSSNEGENAKCDFFIAQFKALSIVPLPYNTNLERIMPDNYSIDENLIAINETPYYRNFIRSRIANSYFTGFGVSFTSDKSIRYSDLMYRINIGSFYQKFKYNANNGKKGMIDAWHGYTFSFNTGFNLKNDEFITDNNWILKGGIRSNYDVWLTNNRFLGIYIYNEIGIRNEYSNHFFTYVPQIGLQLGTLLNINYYNMPLIFRIPTQLFLPLNFHLGSLYSVNNKPLYYYGTEIRVVF